jgi:hypothetical protein
MGEEVEGFKRTLSVPYRFLGDRASIRRASSLLVGGSPTTNEARNIRILFAASFPRTSCLFRRSRLHRFLSVLKENMKADLERRRRDDPNRGNQPAKTYLDSL